MPWRAPGPGPARTPPLARDQECPGVRRARPAILRWPAIRNTVSKIAGQPHGVGIRDDVPLVQSDIGAKALGLADDGNQRRLRGMREMHVRAHSRSAGNWTRQATCRVLPGSTLSATCPIGLLRMRLAGSGGTGMAFRLVDGAEVSPWRHQTPIHQAERSSHAPCAPQEPRAPQITRIRPSSGVRRPVACTDDSELGADAGVPAAGGSLCRASAAEEGEENGVGAVPVRPELRIRAVGARAAEAGYLGEQRGRVEHLDVVPGGEHGCHNLAGLGQMRRAGRVGDHAAWPGRVESRGEQAALQVMELGYVRRRAAPACLGPAAERAES